MQEELKIFDGRNPLNRGVEERPAIHLTDRVLFRRWNRIRDTDLIFISDCKAYFYHPDLRRVPKEQVQSVRSRLFRLEDLCISIGLFCLAYAQQYEKALRDIEAKHRLEAACKIQQEVR